MNPTTNTEAGAVADVAAIARGLTTAQRAALVAADDRWRNSTEIGARGATLTSLCWYWPKGADPISPCLCLLGRDYEDRPLRYIYQRTRLGSLVAAHLTSQGATAGEPLTAQP